MAQDRSGIFMFPFRFLWTFKKVIRYTDSSQLLRLRMGLNDSYRFLRILQRLLWIYKKKDFLLEFFAILEWLLLLQLPIHFFYDSSGSLKIFTNFIDKNEDFLLSVLRFFTTLLAGILISNKLLFCIVINVVVIICNL